MPEPETFWLPVWMVLAARGSSSEDHRAYSEPAAWWTRRPRVLMADAGIAPGGR